MKKLGIIIALLVAACTKPTIESCTDTESLYQQAGFHVGVAVDMAALLTNPTYKQIAQKQFNSITPENIFKPTYLHPQENQFNFILADSLAAFCKTNGKRLHGHTLVWHTQLPQWMMEYNGDWEKLLKTHVQTIVSHFKGRVTSWDVINEAFNEDGTLRNSIWLRKLGSSYIEKAFRYAREADPEALLFYNDFNLVSNPNKLRSVLQLLNSMQARGVKVDGIGMQTHISVQYVEEEQVAEALYEVARHGYKIHLSEIDISINPNGGIIKNKDHLLQQQAFKLAGIVQHYKQLPPHLQYGITFWGISDADSWIPQFYEREDYPLLYNRKYQPKPAYCKLKEAL